MTWNWTTPPGGDPGRSRARKLITSLLVGMLSIGVAWAGVGLVPISVSVEEDSADTAQQAPALKKRGAGKGQRIRMPAALDIAQGQILAGAAKVSLEPRPQDYQEAFPGARWEQDMTKCKTFEPAFDDLQQAPTHVADFRVRWAENPDCLYMGGYGIGPMYPITSWDNEYGLWVRSIAMRDGQGDTVVLTLIDAVYWEAHYNSLCPGEPCGFMDLADQLAEQTGLPAKSFIFASTHSHTSMDFIGGWGAVPDWYMQQATDSLKKAVTQAITAMEPALLEAGESILRERNAERRDFYRSAEDDTISWFRLVEADDLPRPEVCTTPTPTPVPTPSPTSTRKPPPWWPTPTPTPPPPQPTPTPVCQPASSGRAIATVSAYPAHPVTADEDSGRADADFPAVFAKNVEGRFGGVGMFLQTGLGNMSPRGNKIEMGNGMASLIPAIGGGKQVINPNISVGRTFWVQPATNVPLSSLGAAGFFDRTFNQQPATIQVGKSNSPTKQCTSASPLSVETSVSAAKIGSLWITGGPGELFSNISNTIEERNPDGVTMALGLVNDGLGYIVQSFETDHVGRQAVGFVGGGEIPGGGPVEPTEVGLSEYEDAYSIDHCFGDATLEKTIQLLGTL